MPAVASRYEIFSLILNFHLLFWKVGPSHPGDTEKVARPCSVAEPQLN